MGYKLASNPHNFLTTVYPRINPNISKPQVGLIGQLVQNRQLVRHTPQQPNT